MEVEELRRKYVPANSPQCEADVIPLQPGYRKSIPPRCLRTSQYKIDGKCYCAFHAGRIALDKFISQQKATMLTSQQPSEG